MFDSSNATSITSSQRTLIFLIEFAPNQVKPHKWEKLV